MEGTTIAIALIILGALAVGFVKLWAYSKAKEKAKRADPSYPLNETIDSWWDIFQYPITRFIPMLVVMAVGFSMIGTISKMVNEATANMTVTDYSTQQNVTIVTSETFAGHVLSIVPIFFTAVVILMPILFIWNFVRRNDSF